MKKILLFVFLLASRDAYSYTAICDSIYNNYSDIKIALSNREDIIFPKSNSTNYCIIVAGNNPQLKLPEGINLRNDDGIGNNPLVMTDKAIILTSSSVIDGIRFVSKTYLRSPKNNKTAASHSGIAVSSGATYFKIKNSKFVGFLIAIKLLGKKESLIKNFSINDNYFFYNRKAVVIETAQDFEINRNNISTFTTGIELSGASNGEISFNTITGSKLNDRNTVLTGIIFRPKSLTLGINSITKNMHVHDNAISGIDEELISFDCLCNSPNEQSQQDIDKVISVDLVGDNAVIKMESSFWENNINNSYVGYHINPLELFDSNKETLEQFSKRSSSQSESFRIISTDKNLITIYIGASNINRLRKIFIGNYATIEIPFINNIVENNKLNFNSGKAGIQIHGSGHGNVIRGNTITANQNRGVNKAVRIRSIRSLRKDIGFALDKDTGLTSGLRIYKYLMSRDNIIEGNIITNSDILFELLTFNQEKPSNVITTGNKACENIFTNSGSVLISENDDLEPTFALEPCI